MAKLGPVSAAEKKRRSAALRAWCKQRGKGAITFLAREVPLTWAGASRIVHGKAAPRPETASAIERATEGAVRAAVLLGLEAA